MPVNRDTGLSANYSDEVMDSIKQEFREGVENLRDAIYADGRPPLTAPLEPHEQLAKLEQMRAAGDPRAMSAEAQRDYQQLKQRTQRGAR